MAGRKKRTEGELLMRAEAAERLLSDPLTAEGFDEAEAAIKRLWGDTVPGASAEREALYFQLRGLRALRGFLTRTRDAGKVARATANQQANGAGSEPERRRES